VEIHEYHKSFLHAKVAVIDDTWATVGSSNIDPFSLLLAREANIVVDDARFAAELRASLGHALETGAKQVRAENWHRRPWGERVAHWAAYGFARLLTGVFAYGQRQDFT
ncbi:MAG TPA: phospholipase D-like domain-containing protein, partial [Burkholderiales bacterium]|nr:phospholipase D-like domain-containing protein [Burkholderiales bacterium]